MYREFFVYSTGAQSVGASATVNVTISISADSDFEVLKLTARPTNWNFTIQIQDTVTSKFWQDRALHAETILGSAMRPFILPVPRKLRANSSILVTLVDLSGIAQTIYVDFIGHKLYGVAGAN